MKNVVVYDTETTLMRPGAMAPELVCLTWASPGETPQTHIIHAEDPEVLPLVESWLTSECLLVGHHVVYDNAVLCAKWPHLTPLVFAKYDRDQITCTKIRMQLLDIAAGEFRGKYVDREGNAARWVPHGYSLDDLTFRTSGRRLQKGRDSWRLRYQELMHIPLFDWPQEAIEYPMMDADVTLEAFLKQEEHVEYIPDQFRQARAAWALHLTSVWGLRTHGPGVDRLEAETIAALAQIEDGLKGAGLVRHNGSRDTKKAKARMVEVCAREGLTLRLTDKKQVSLDADACEATGDDLLEDYAALTSLKAVLSKDVPALRSGTVTPVHTSFGLAASGRVTSSNPNVQNPRRQPGIREAFQPRHGKVFAQADFSALELHTLAQVCVSLFGQSALAKALNAGRDPHTEMAAKLLSLSYEDGVRLKKAGDARFDDARQTSKVANFGIPGGLGAEKLVLFARKSYGVVLTESQAKDLKKEWLEKWPEMHSFFSHVAGLFDGDSGEATVQQLFSNRWRGGCHYTACANTFFQGLGADAAKRATYLVSRACYAEQNSLLFGSRLVNQVHDEIILETDDSPKAHDVAVELGRLMVQGANEFLPDVPARCEPLLARCWSKAAKPVYKDGRLVPWEPAL